MSVKGKPKKRIGVTVHNVVEMIYSYRLSRGFTQADLAEAIGSYTLGKSRINIIQIYESGSHLPDINNIYMLAEVLGIEKESFFNMILREHYNRFTAKHHEKFSQSARRKKKGESISLDNLDCKYGFTKCGEVKHDFSKSSAILKNAFLKMGITYKDLIIRMENHKGIQRKYHYSTIYNAINGRRVTGLKTILDLCEFFKIKPFKVYKLMVEEKALAHAKNMVLQWNKYKIEREKDDNIVEEANRFQMA